MKLKDTVFPAGTNFPGGSVVKNLPASAGDAEDVGWIPGLGRSPGEGCGNPLQYSCLEDFHRQWSLAGYNPWGHKESGMTERLTLSLSHFPFKNI